MSVKNVKVAIVEDEVHIREELVNDLRRYGTEHAVDFSIREFTDGDGITAHYAPVYDLILMDVEMPLLDGMSAASEIRRVDDAVTIIFITNAPQYAISGYKVGALDYLLKPVSYFAFSESLRRAIAKLSARGARGEYITIDVRGGTRKLGVDAIRYVEVIDHELYFHGFDDVVQTRGTIREVEKQLEPYPFFKCNKGCLVNLAHVDGCRKTDVLIGDEAIPVSRARRKPLLSAVHDYLDGTT